MKHLRFKILNETSSLENISKTNIDTQLACNIQSLRGEREVESVGTTGKYFLDLRTGLTRRKKQRFFMNTPYFT